MVGVAQAGGPVAALGGAAAVAESQGDDLDGGEQSACLSEVEDLGVGAEDDGDDLRFAGVAPRLAGGEVLAGVEGRALQAGSEVGEGGDREQGGGESAGAGCGVGGVGLDELAEGFAELRRGGLVLDPALAGPRLFLVALRCFGAAKAISIFCRVRPWASGRVNLPVAAPWPSKDRWRRRCCRARASAFSRARRSWSSPISGAITDRIRAPRMRSSAGSWSAARSTRWASALVEQSGVDDDVAGLLELGEVRWRGRRGHGR